MAEAKKGKVGRPAKEINVEQALKLAAHGFTAEEIAGILGVSEATWYNYQKAHPEILDSLKAAKDKADNEVIRGLYERAVGYSHPDVHICQFQGQVIITPIIKHYPPDTTAAAIWLNNRRPKDWKQRKVEIDIPEGKRLIIEDAD